MSIFTKRDLELLQKFTIPTWTLFILTGLLLAMLS